MGKRGRRLVVLNKIKVEEVTIQGSWGKRTGVRGGEDA